MPFSNTEAVRLRFQGFAGDCVLALEKDFPQEVLDQIEASVMPAPTDTQKAEAYAEARTLLASRGIYEGDPVVAAMSLEAVKLGGPMLDTKAEEL